MVKLVNMLIFLKSIYGGNTIKIRNKDISFIVHPSLNGENI